MNDNTKECCTLPFARMWLVTMMMMCLAMVTFSNTCAAKDVTVDIEQLLNDLGWEGQIGQMAQIDISLLIQDGEEDETLVPQLDVEKATHYIGTLGVGSVLNNVAWKEGDLEHGRFWKASDFRNITIQLQDIAKSYGRPPVIWGLDSVHGANYIWDSVISPQPLNLAATFNTTVAYQAGVWASRDTRKAGIPWLFSPLLGLSWNSFWSRTYETFGEDPVLVGDMASAMIQGIQALSKDGIVPSRAAACDKHWVGYSYPHNGHDRAPSWIPRRHLYQYFLRPWRNVLLQHQTSNTDDEPLLTVMESYTETDGVPNVANRQSLTKILRHELQFRGMLVTDYHEMFNLFEWHHTAANRSDALKQSVSEGSVDMSMIANEPDDFFGGMHNLDPVTFGQRIRTSARRVLMLKQSLNMFEESFDMHSLPSVPGDGTSSTTSISKHDLQAALEMTQQSIVLAMNDDVLPLNPSDALKILVTGPTSRSLSFQSGGWTGQWQGVNSNHEDKWFTYGNTVLGAFQKQATIVGSSSKWDVSYECGVDILGNDCESDGDTWRKGDNDGFVDTIKGWVGWKDEHYAGIESAMQKAKTANVVVVCLGEENYTEKPGDIRDLKLPQGQYELVAGIRNASPETKIILVYFGGRPRILEDVVPVVDAVLLGFLPGPLAGDALVDIISGQVNPSGRLPITYPKYQDLGGVPYLHAVSDMCTEDTGVLPHWNNVPCDVQWPFGHGLSYTEFEYSDLSVNTKTLRQQWDKDEQVDLEVTVMVTNKGDVPGSETVLFFTFDDFRSTTPEDKQLRGYQKVWLEPGASTVVTLTIHLDDLRFVGPHDDTHYILEDGLTFRIGVGPYVDCRRAPGDQMCSTPVTVQTESNYVAACESACDLWKQSGCNTFTPQTCRTACSSIETQNHGSNGKQLDNDGWGWTYVTCLESIVWNEEWDSSSCWKMTSLCRDVLRTGGMDEFGSGKATSGFSPIGISTVAVSMSLFAGIFAAVMIYVAIRGRFERSTNQTKGDVEFQALFTVEIS